jgi:hypothetical protein
MKRLSSLREIWRFIYALPASTTAYCRRAIGDAADVATPVHETPPPRPNPPPRYAITFADTLIDDATDAMHNQSVARSPSSADRHAQARVRHAYATYARLR